MDGFDYLLTLRQKWPVVVATTLIGILLSFGFASQMPKSYASKSAVLLTVQRTADMADYRGFVNQQVSAFASIAQTPQVLEPVARKMRLATTGQQLASAITASTSADVPLIEIRAVGDDPKMSADMANLVATAVNDTVTQWAPRGADNAPLVSSRTVESASPGSPTSTMRNPLLIGAFLGFLVGAAWACRKGAGELRLRGSGALRRVTSAPVVADIPLCPEWAPLPQHLGRSATADAYRHLRTQLMLGGAGPIPRPSVVLAPATDDRAHRVAVDLSIALAATGQRVLLIDADTNTRAISAALRQEAAPGLADVLHGDLDVASAIRPGAAENVDFLPAGRADPASEDLLASTARQEMIRRLVHTYDAVVTFCPPATRSASGLVLSAAAGGALLVVRDGHVAKRDLNRALEELVRVGVEDVRLIRTGVTTPRHRPSETAGRPEPSRATESVSVSAGSNRAEQE